MDVKFQIVPDLQTVSVPFRTTVTIKNATPGTSIDVRLKQVVGGTFSASSTAAANGNGTASADFDVTLTAAGRAALVAAAVDLTNGDFGHDLESVTVRAAGS